MIKLIFGPDIELKPEKTQFLSAFNQVVSQDIKRSFEEVHLNIRNIEFQLLYYEIPQLSSHYPLPSSDALSGSSITGRLGCILGKRLSSDTALGSFLGDVGACLRIVLFG